MTTNAKGKPEPMTPDHPRYREWTKAQDDVQRLAEEGKEETPEYKKAITKLESLVSELDAGDQLDVE